MCPLNTIKGVNQQANVVYWELTDEDALPKGSTLSGSKVLMDEYPDDETNSKKTKKSSKGKNNTGKSKHVNPEHHK